MDSPRTEWNVYYYYALITLQDASQLRTAPADNQSFISPGQGARATIARRMNAVLRPTGTQRYGLWRKGRQLHSASGDGVPGRGIGRGWICC